MQEVVIKTDNLTKYYGEIKAVQDLNLEVRVGEVYGFLGPNGAGKTTTIRMLLNFVFPTSGSATVLGYDPTKNPTAITQDVGYIAGDVALYPDYTVKEFLDFFEVLNGQPCPKKAELLRRFDLDVTRKINELSKGNKQKVAIVQAFMNSPKLLILDEPTSGLDPLLQLEFYKLINEIKSEGSTIFVSSHVLSEVQRICDRVGIIKNGELVSTETIAELRNRNIYNVTIGADDKILKSLMKLEGTDNIIRNNGDLQFTFNGDVNQLLTELVKVKINDIKIVEPSLEELFIHYYSDVSEAKGEVKNES